MNAKEKRLDPLIQKLLKKQKDEVEILKQM